MRAGHNDRRVLQDEFNRAAESFARRTRNRFDDLDALGFSGVQRGAKVLEVGVGTGNFLRYFDPVAAQLVGVDIVHGMLGVARRDQPQISPVLADGRRLPFAPRTFDLVTSAQTLHHVNDPIPFLREMRRVVKDSGRVLLVDQVATERYEEIAFRDQLEVLRDPSHAVSRPPSAFSIMVQAVGMSVVAQKIVTSQSRLSEWMWPGEFPPERIAAVRDFIERFGHETGMEWRREGDDWVYTSRRLMLLATRRGVATLR